MTAHVSERACAEVESATPVAGMIVAIANEWAVVAHAEPALPIEACWDFIGPIRLAGRIAPLFAGPGVNFLDLADGTFLNPGHG